MAAAGAYFLSVGLIVPTLPLYVAREQGGNELLVALVVGAPAVTGLAARPIAGRLALRYGTRRLMVLGAVCAGISVLLYPVPSSPGSLFCMRLLTGVGEGVFFTGATTLVTNVVPGARRGAGFSLLSATVFLGTGVGFLFAVPLADHAGPAVALAAPGLLTLTAAAVSALVGRAGDPGGRVLHRTRLLDRRAFGPGGAMALCSMGTAGFFAFVPLYALSVGAPVQAVFTVYAAVVLSVRLLGSSIPDRLGAFRCGMAAGSLEACGLATTSVVDTQVGLMVGTVLFALGTSLLYPALLSMVLDRGAARERPALVGTFTMSLDVGEICGAVLLGAAANELGLRASFGVAAIFSVLALVVLGLLRRVRTWSR